MCWNNYYLALSTLTGTKNHSPFHHQECISFHRLLSQKHSSTPDEYFPPSTMIIMIAIAFQWYIVNFSSLSLPQYKKGRVGYWIKRLILVSALTGLAVLAKARTNSEEPDVAMIRSVSCHQIWVYLHANWIRYIWYYNGLHLLASSILCTCTNLWWMYHQFFCFFAFLFHFVVANWTEFGIWILELVQPSPKRVVLPYCAY